MKKVISIISSLAMCITLTACSNSNSNSEQSHIFDNIGFAPTFTDYMITSNSFDDVIKESDFIVVGEFINDETVCYERYEYSDYFQKDILCDIWSSCPMKITKVLYGNAKAGDVVDVIQWEGIWEDRFITSSNLTPMQKGDEWVFCLYYVKNDNFEGYRCTGDFLGRFPTSNVSSNQKRCFSDYPELGMYEPNDIAQEYYKQFVEKYGVQ